jgi:hypothetical protein
MAPGALMVRRALKSSLTDRETGMAEMHTAKNTD